MTLWPSFLLSLLITSLDLLNLSDLCLILAFHSECHHLPSCFQIISVYQQQKYTSLDFLGSPVVKRLCTSNAESIVSIPGQGTKILHATRQKKKNYTCWTKEKKVKKTYTSWNKWVKGKTFLLPDVINAVNFYSNFFFFFKKIKYRSRKQILDIQLEITLYNIFML